ncbi:hypothetical protein F4678DRAFT_445013 [Xylaria arbuscula]|nr:hypothetical protein F4678DRAFT_445013 [Xylaria arbuscula]
MGRASRKAQSQAHRRKDYLSTYTTAVLYLNIMYVGMYVWNEILTMIDFQPGVFSFLFHSIIFIPVGSAHWA